MKIKPIQKLFILFLTLLFTAALTFASLELPHLLDKHLQSNFSFPGFDHSLTDLNLSKTELYIEHFHIRTIGYICLIAVFLLIIAGYITNRTGLSSAGAVMLFLPVFGSFAFSMFFLAGLGFLRWLWLPFTELSSTVMKLGDVVLVPYQLFMWIGSLLNTYPRQLFITLCIGVGLFLFISGTVAWFYARFKGAGVADFFVYRISRHPQYLGWIIWSYGIFLISNDHFKKTWNYPDSLPWLLSCMIIIGIAMLEEIKMMKRIGKAYDDYKLKTHFLFPLPRIVKQMIYLPVRWILRIKNIEKKRHVAAVIVFYLILLMTVSYFINRKPPVNIKLQAKTEIGRVEELVDILRNSDQRRMKSFASEDLVQYGEQAADSLIRLLKDPDPVVRDFSIQALSKMKHQKAVPALMLALKDKDRNVRFSAAVALGELKAGEAKQEIMGLLNDTESLVQSAAVTALVKLGAPEAVDLLIERLNDQNKWTLRETIHTLGKLRDERAVEAVIPFLQHNEVMVRQAAAVALAYLQSPKSKSALTEAVKDKNWEVRIYAAEALKRINRR